MNTNEQSFVAYCRVSTRKQGVSGLGLEAQKDAVIQYVKPRGAVIAEYVEVETGKNDNRIELNKAIKHAKQAGAVLVVAKLDRLSRNAAFLMALNDSSINFVCADLPEANTLTIGIFATIAQYEREIISSRTKAALKVKKQNGFKLGSPANLTDLSRAKSIEIRKINSLNDENNRRAACVIETMKEAGKSYKEIASQLNNHGYKTRRGCEFNPVQVLRIYKGLIAA